MPTGQGKPMAKTLAVHILSRRAFFNLFIRFLILAATFPIRRTAAAQLVHVPRQLHLIKVRVKSIVESVHGMTAIEEREHCSLDRATLDKIGGLKRQILLQCDNNRTAYALYTVKDEDVRPSSVPICRMTSKGLKRLHQEQNTELGATINRTVTRAAEFMEYLSVGTGNGLAILAPHGGDIEPGTAEQAQQLEALLLSFGKPTQCWFCEGSKKPGDPKGAAYQRWHITSTDISEYSFPKLGELFKTKFEYAVAFHGWSKVGIGVGGSVDNELKIRIRDAIRSRNIGGINIEDIRVLTEVEAFAGSHPHNIINRIASAGNGIQIEQSAIARKKGNREKIVQAVADVYKTLI